MASPNYIKFDDLKLPLLEDSASIQIAILKITAAFLSSRIDARHTGACSSTPSRSPRRISIALPPVRNPILSTP